MLRRKDKSPMPTYLLPILTGFAGLFLGWIVARLAAAAKLAVMEQCGFTITRNPSEMAKLLKAMM